MQGELKRLPLAPLLGDRRLAYRDPLDRWEGGAALRRSLERAGQLQPLTLFADGPTLRVSAGFRRVQALAELGVQEAWAYVSREPPPVLFRQAVEAHAGQSANLRERARALQIGHALGLERAALCQLLAALGQPAQGHLVEQHLRLAAIPPLLLDLLVAKGFSLRRCLPFCELAADKAELLAQVATALRLGGRQIEETCTALLEIAAREQLSLSQVIEELGLLAADAGEQPGAEQAARRPDGPTLLERISRRRLPETYRRRDALSERCAEFGIGQVRFDPSLASEGVEIILRLQQAAELRPLGEALASPEAQERLDQILDLL